MIKNDTFSGRVPALSARLLGADDAQIATNCKVDSGYLEPLLDSSLVHTIPKTGSHISTYKTDTDWLAWVADVDVVSSFTTDNPDRFYFTDGTIPKQSDNTLATSGVETGWPTASWRLGIPAPTAALQTQVITPGIGSLEFSSNWVYTYVTTFGTTQEESKPSPATATVDVKSDEDIRLTTFSKPEDADLNITHYRIYRLVVDSRGIESYHFVAEVASTATQYDDTATDATIGGTDTLLTETFDPPPATMKGITQYANGCLVGFDDNTICFSEPGYAYAWPIDYRRTVPDTIVGLGVFGNNIVVCTDGLVHVITGVDPANLTQKTIAIKPCKAKRSIVSTPLGVFFSGEDGMYLVDQSGIANITGKVFTKKQWVDLNTTNLQTVYHNNKIFCFFLTTGTGFYFNLKDGKVFDFSLAPRVFRGIFYDGKDIYILADVSGVYSVYKWEGSTTKLSYTWQSKLYQAYSTINFSCGRVISAGPITLSLYGNGDLIHTRSVADDFVFRLPGSKRNNQFYYKVSGLQDVYSVGVAQSVEELK